MAVNVVCIRTVCLRAPDAQAMMEAYYDIF